MSVAIKIENLSKQYRLGLVSTRTLSHDLNRWWQTSVLGREDPYLKIGQENILSSRNSQIPNPKSQIKNQKSQDYVWALKDINLEVEQGEVLGIIGKNGAGKSTLLKILSKVTAPTTGVVKARGRIASLLEVGTGFHQEMTGRENIYMNGAIMGMTKKEITRKLDEIVDFAGVERYLDTPVKRYSSGMTVRLGFSVAAHLEPEILVVDEVLAVGDAEFQKKAIGKMQNVSKEEGRTVLFVSHNMDSILRLCERCILIENSRMKIEGFADKIINYYLEKNFGITSKKEWSLNTIQKSVMPISIEVHDINFTIKDVFLISEKVGITFKYEVLCDGMKVIPGIKLFNHNEINILDSHENLGANKLYKSKGVYKSTVWLHENFFNEGLLILDVGLLQPDPLLVYFFEKGVIAFNMIDKGKNITRGEYVGAFPGIIRPFFVWKTNKIDV